MKLSGLGVLASVLLISGCATQGSDDFKVGDPEDCSGVLVVAHYGILSEEHVSECVEFSEPEVAAREVVSFAGLTLEGTAEYGDQIVCRVNGLPSDSEEIVVPGEDPHLEKCQEMPPAFAYWALWVKNTPEEPWTYASEGIGTLRVKPGMSVGLAFSTGGETPTPSDP